MNKNMYKAYHVNDIRGDGDWFDRIIDGTSTENRHGIIYVDETLTVRELPIKETTAILDRSTDAWKDFCNHTLKLHIADSHSPSSSTTEHETHNTRVQRRPDQDESIPILPIHLHCLAQPDSHPHIFNICSLLDTYAYIHPEMFFHLFGSIIERYDALRLRFRQVDSAWQAFIAKFDSNALRI